MSKMIFVTGFARGGTTWLRSCIASHPDIAAIPKELVLFRDFGQQRDSIEQEIEETIRENKLEARFYVSKAPANAPYVGSGCKLFPDSKFIFIIRDPRDVFISHKRGTRQWMGGKNSTVEGCMEKIESYYKGYLEGKTYSNLLLVKYEELHQDFYNIMSKVYRFIGVEDNREILHKAFKENDFAKTTGRRNIEDRNSAKRKGVVGDWANFLSEKETQWYKENPFWSDFMATYNYQWEYPTFEKVLTAMKEGGVKDLTEEDLLSSSLDCHHANVLILHDIDALNTEKARQSVLETAKIEGKLGIASVFNFLPIDDVRYASLKPEEVLDIIQKIRLLAPRSSIGLHLNATERFFPKDMEDVGDEHPDMAKAIAYLHEQIDVYEKYGVKFRVSTAHGYGRAKKLPNNRDSKIFTAELEKRGILLFDTVIRPRIDSTAKIVVRFTDVGESLSIRELPTSGPVDRAETYQQLPPGSLIRFLSHPGNYDMYRPLTLSMRRY